MAISLLWGLPCTLIPQDRIQKQELVERFCQELNINGALRQGRDFAVYKLTAVKDDETVNAGETVAVQISKGGLTCKTIDVLIEENDHLTAQRDRLQDTVLQLESALSEATRAHALLVEGTGDHPDEEPRRQGAQAPWRVGSGRGAVPPLSFAFKPDARGGDTESFQPGGPAKASAGGRGGGGGRGLPVAAHQQQHQGADAAGAGPGPGGGSGQPQQQQQARWTSPSGKSGGRGRGVGETSGGAESGGGGERDRRVDGGRGSPNLVGGGKGERGKRRPQDNMAGGGQELSAPGGRAGGAGGEPFPSPRIHLNIGVGGLGGGRAGLGLGRGDEGSGVGPQMGGRAAVPRLDLAGIAKAAEPQPPKAPRQPHGVGRIGPVAAGGGGGGKGRGQKGAIPPNSPRGKNQMGLQMPLTARAAVQSNAEKEETGGTTARKGGRTHRGPAPSRAAIAGERGAGPASTSRTGSSGRASGPVQSSSNSGGVGGLLGTDNAAAGGGKETVRSVAASTVKDSARSAIANQNVGSSSVQHQSQAAPPTLSSGSHHVQTRGGVKMPALRLGALAEQKSESQETGAEGGDEAGVHRRPSLSLAEPKMAGGAAPLPDKKNRIAKKKQRDVHGSRQHQIPNPPPHPDPSLEAAPPDAGGGPSAHASRDLPPHSAGLSASRQSSKASVSVSHSTSTLGHQRGQPQQQRGITQQQKRNTMMNQKQAGGNAAQHNRPRPTQTQVVPSWHPPRGGGRGGGRGRQGGGRGGRGGKQTANRRSAPSDGERGSVASNPASLSHSHSAAGSVQPLPPAGGLSTQEGGASEELTHTTPAPEPDHTHEASPHIQSSTASPKEHAPLPTQRGPPTHYPNVAQPPMLGQHQHHPGGTHQSHHPHPSFHPPPPPSYFVPHHYPHTLVSQPTPGAYYGGAGGGETFGGPGPQTVRHYPTGGYGQVAVPAPGPHAQNLGTHAPPGQSTIVRTTHHYQRGGGD